MYSEVLKSDGGIRRPPPSEGPGPGFDAIKARMTAWMQRLDSEDPYRVLAVDPGASPEAIRDRYRELASRHHPDHGGDPARMREVNQAYERIRNAKKPVAVVGPVRRARSRPGA
jgi:hypothetical protein